MNPTKQLLEQWQTAILDGYYNPARESPEIRKRLVAEGYLLSVKPDMNHGLSFAATAAGLIWWHEGTIQIGSRRSAECNPARLAEPDYAEFFNWWGRGVGSEICFRLESGFPTLHILVEALKLEIFELVRYQPSNVGLGSSFIDLRLTKRGVEFFDALRPALEVC